MNATRKRCPLPFLILLIVLWLIQSMQLRIPDGFPARQLSLVEPPERAYIQTVSGRDISCRDTAWKEIFTP